MLSSFKFFKYWFLFGYSLTSLLNFLSILRLVTLILFLQIFTQLGIAQESDQQFTVMAWNILHGARDIENGPQQAIEIIREINPDIICMVETYGSGKMISEELGYKFHLVAKEGTPPLTNPILVNLLKSIIRRLTIHQTTELWSRNSH